MPSGDRVWWGRYALLGAVCALGFAVAVGWAAFAILKPTPPRSVSMAVGPDDELGPILGQRYRTILARDGIDLKLVSTAGAVASAALLRNSKSGVAIAILPSGLTNDKESPELVSLGTLFYEPLWLFYRGQSGEHGSGLKNMRIAVGPEGSGSRTLTLEFFARAGIIDQAPDKLLPLTPSESVAKLLSGEIDAVSLLAGWDSPGVQRLLVAPGVKLFSAGRPDAWVALYPFLNKLILPAGVANMAEDIPPNDVVLLAPKASLIVRRDLHPAVQCLLMEAAAEVHAEPGVFRKSGEFPAPEAIDLPLSKEARQFYKSGPPFLQRHLPYWLAVFIQQLLVLAIPVLGILYPLLRYAPALFGWLVRQRVYGLYSELMQLESEVRAGAADGEGKSAQMARLDRLEEKASQFRVPNSFEPLVYDLRSHISLVREKIARA